MQPDQTHHRAEDERWMRRALDLAHTGAGLTSPNPMVGAVLVRDGSAVGEGAYTYDGVRHAEMLALEQAGEAARGATLYINLEPCAHFGRTPPCADALAAAGIARVVAGMQDPNPQVSGRGFLRLRAAGVAVEEDLLGEECRALNEPFARYIRGGVFVTLKSAMTLDGRIAAPQQTPERRWITGEPARDYVQRLRHRHDAVITGVGTVAADDPLLTDRTGLPRRRPLLRVVMDSTLRTRPDSQLVESARGDVLVVCGPASRRERAVQLEKRGAEVLRLESGGRATRPGWYALLSELRHRQVASALLEAGAALNASALECSIVDKVVFFYAPLLLGGDDAVPVFRGRGFRTLAAARPVRVTAWRRLGQDLLLEGYLRDVYGDR